ncbi:GxxExxY protein [Parafilimonas sp.]|uniref:GxxExxY protein n=1 Tax=Parafilimonas sp. TaxID=1969739 RepID=UPI0039E3F6B9
MTENELAKIVVGLCLKIHRILGPGLLESVYEEALCYELAKAGLHFKRQQGISFMYEEVKMDLGFRSDVIVEDKLMIELKSVETVAPVHYKILLTYLRLTNIKLGLMINFNVELIKNGIKRVVNNL